MSSAAWNATVRLALQRYGAPSVLAGGLFVASAKSEGQKLDSKSTTAVSSLATTAASMSPFLFPSLTYLPRTLCEAPPSSTSSEDSATSTTSKTNWKDPHYENTSSAKVRKRMTQVGRFSLLSETSTNPSVPFTIICLSGEPFTAKDFAKIYKTNGLDETHERFRSHLETSSRDGPIPSHFLVRPLDKDDKDNTNLPTLVNGRKLPVRELLSYPQVYRSEVKSLIVEAMMSPIPMDETLWEAWTATGGEIGQSGMLTPTQAQDIREAYDRNPLPASPTRASNRPVESLFMFRSHHCMMDGVSAGQMFLDFMDEGDELKAMIHQRIEAFMKRKKSWYKKLQFFLYYWCWGSLKTFWHFITMLVSTFFAPAPWARIREAFYDNATAADLENQPARTISWIDVGAVDEVKEVAAYFSQFTEGKVTINDIFCSCVSGAIAKLLQHHRQTNSDIPSLDYLTLALPFHIFGGVLPPGHSLGNKIGAVGTRLPSEAIPDPQERLLEVHETMSELKRRPDGFWLYSAAKLLGSVGGILGRNFTSGLLQGSSMNASVVVSNVRGPEDVNHVAGRKIESALGFLPLPPGIPLGVAVVSSRGILTLTVTAEPWAAPDADLFLYWIVEEYQTLLEQARANAKKQR